MLLIGVNEFICGVVATNGILRILIGVRAVGIAIPIDCRGCVCGVATIFGAIFWGVAKPAFRFIKLEFGDCKSD